MLIYNLGQKVFKFCTFLATERLYRGFGTALTPPPLAPPRQRCSVGGRNDPAGSQHCFLFGEGKVLNFVVACAFKSFTLKLDKATSTLVGAYQNHYVSFCS